MISRGPIQVREPQTIGDVTIEGHNVGPKWSVEYWWMGSVYTITIEPSADTSRSPWVFAPGRDYGPYWEECTRRDADGHEERIYGTYVMLQPVSEPFDPALKLSQREWCEHIETYLAWNVEEAERLKQGIYPF